RARGGLTLGALGVSALLLVVAGLFNFVAMRVPESRPLVAVGQPVPDFTPADAAGRLVTLSDYRGKKPVVAARRPAQGRLSLPRRHRSRGDPAARTGPRPGRCARRGRA